MGQGQSGIVKGEKNDSTLQFEPGLKKFPPEKNKPVKGCKYLVFYECFTY